MHDREDGESGVVVNLANVVSVRVSKTDSATTGSTCDSWRLLPHRRHRFDAHRPPPGCAYGPAALKP